jgi:hypothetical protein
MVNEPEELQGIVINALHGLWAVRIPNLTDVIPTLLAKNTKKIWLIKDFEVKMMKSKIENFLMTCQIRQSWTLQS